MSRAEAAASRNKLMSPNAVSAFAAGLTPSDTAARRRLGRIVIAPAAIAERAAAALPSGCEARRLLLRLLLPLRLSGARPRGRRLPQARRHCDLEAVPARRRFSRDRHA